MEPCWRNTACGQPGSFRAKLTRTAWSSKPIDVPSRFWRRCWCCAEATTLPALKQCWVREVIEREHNALLGEKLAEERRHLHALPAMALPAYTSMTVKVRRWSTIRVLNHTYSVPARLIGEQVRVLLRHDHLEVYFAGKMVERLPRIRGQRAARIDYHHVIWSLVKKPGAFARYRWREELFPSLVFPRAYDALRSFHGGPGDPAYLPTLSCPSTTRQPVV